MGSRKMSTSKPKGISIQPNMESSKDYPNLPEVIGLPPSSGSGLKYTEDVLRNSSLVLKISPCIPKFEKGMSLFRLDEDWNTYKKLLNQHYFSPNSIHDISKCIYVAVQADTFPTDSFTNEYGEHFLNKITDVASSAFGEFAQMMGKEHAIESMKSLGSGATEMGAETIGGIITGAANQAEKLKTKMGSSTNDVIKGMANMADRLLAGARIDFPMVWKNSSYAPTFSFNIRLWNPEPGNDEITNTNIIGPIAALLLLALPRTTEEQEDFSSYNWPFFCKVDCAGLFNIHAGAITNISISKGGEGGQIAYNHRLGLVDIRIDFINLHNSLIISKYGHESRPTLQGYLNNLKKKSTLSDIYEKADYYKSSIATEQEPENNPSGGTPMRSPTTTDVTTPPTSRVDPDIESTFSQLSAITPSL